MEMKIYEMPETRLPFRFRSSQDVYNSLKTKNSADREMFFVLLLDAKNKVMEIEVHSVGTLDSCGVYPREIIKSCLLKRASSLIVVHNHPSGELDRSRGDDEITKAIMMCCELMQIKFLDHLIIGNGRYFSYSDEGLLGDYETEIKRRIG